MSFIAIDNITRLNIITIYSNHKGTSANLLLVNIKKYMSNSETSNNGKSKKFWSFL